MTRGDKLHVSGFFNAKLRGSQTTWLPCEVEALSIPLPALGIHFLICRKPLPGFCKALISSRQTLEAATPPSVKTRPVRCVLSSRELATVVRAVSVQDILQGSVHLPFTSWPAWLAVKSECPGLRRRHAHLVQGRRSSKKLTNIKDVKRYLQVASIANDGVLVV